jgi:hypothetical protein
MQLVERLPVDAPKSMIDTWERVYKKAKETYNNDLAKAAATAWSVVKKKYKKTADGKWVTKEAVEALECIDPNICNLLHSEKIIKKIING